jgi:hypothetical protein
MEGKQREEKNQRRSKSKESGVEQVSRESNVVGERRREGEKRLTLLLRSLLASMHQG